MIRSHGIARCRRTARLPPLRRILITGACGQIGTELTTALRTLHGGDSVVATDVQPLPAHLTADGPGERLDVTNRDALADLVRRHRIDTIYHLAAILSATGEDKPRLAWQVNIGGLTNVLEVAREEGVVARLPSLIYRRIRAPNAQGWHAAGDRLAAHNHVRRHQGLG